MCQILIKIILIKNLFETEISKANLAQVFAGPALSSVISNALLYLQIIKRLPSLRRFAVF
jgi:hypothetical protein